MVDGARGSSGSGDTTTRVVPRTFVFIVDRGCLGGKDKVRHSHVAKRVLPAWSLYFPWHSRTFSLFLPQGRVSAPKFIFRHGQRYRLCRIVQHIGDTLQKGHYVVAVWKSGRWCRCSDADVASLSPRGLADMEPSVAMYEICSSTISAKPRSKTRRAPNAAAAMLCRCWRTEATRGLRCFTPNVRPRRRRSRWRRRRRTGLRRRTTERVGRRNSFEFSTCTSRLRGV